MSTESKLHPVFQKILEAHGLASVQQPSPLESKLAELARLLEELKDNVEFRAGNPGSCLLLDKAELSKPEPTEGGELCLVVWVS